MGLQDDAKSRTAAAAASNQRIAECDTAAAAPTNNRPLHDGEASIETRSAMRIASSAPHQGYEEAAAVAPLQQGQSAYIPLQCRTRLLTQAVNLAITTTQRSGSKVPTTGGIINEVTPPTAALESPSSPPIAAASSPASLSVGSPSSTFSRASPTTDNQSPSSPTSKAAAAARSSGNKRGVPHIYRDFTHVPDMTGYVRKKTGGVTQPFPEKLHEMLDNVNEPSVVGWLPHGRAFIVRKPKEFTSRIMPKFFRQTKLTSFQRQLNLYGFRRLTQGADSGAYYHELFLRGRPQLCMRMQRQKVKGTGHKQPADAKTEPNFYVMVPSNYAASPSMEPHLPPGDEEEPTTPHPLDESYSSMSNTTNAVNYEEMSPGMQGLHGAAHLLKNISAGVMASSILAGRSTFSLGESALSTPKLSRREGSAPPPNAYSSYQASLPGKLPAKKTMPPPAMDGSMSLLGRVNMDPPPSSSRDNNTAAPNLPASSLQTSKTAPVAQSAFFWPPIRRTQEPPVVLTARDEAILTSSPPGRTQQESAQPSSSHAEQGNGGADPNQSEWSPEGSRSSSKDSATSGQRSFSQDEEQRHKNRQELAQLQEDGKVGKLIKVPPSLTSPLFPANTSLTSDEDSGPMETKVSNGIETEEV